MSNQYIVSIIDKEGNEKKGIVYANSYFTALIKFANQVANEKFDKLVPKPWKS